jgi:hypothetical protein
MKERGGYTRLLNKFYVYNTPNSISSIIQIINPFIDPVVRPKFVLYNKNESDELIQNLLNI